MRRPFIFICAFLLLSSACRQGSQAEYQFIKSDESDKAMVVSAHPIASEIGLQILRDGGNAADAAIAVQFALAVVYPRAGNIGGGGFLVYRTTDGEVLTLDYREKAPLASHRDMYLDSSGMVIENKSTDGIQAAGIPGSVAGMIETHTRLGRLQPWSRLVQPAIDLAEKGFRITTREADRLNQNQSSFTQYNPYPIPFVKDSPWKAGDLLVQKDLAQTLRQIASQGRDGFYAGSNADILANLSRQSGGYITREDLHAYDVKWRDPMRIQWREYSLYTMGLPSSGGILLSQILGMIGPHAQDSLGPQSLPYIHLLVEAERRAYADRAAFLGDPDFYPVDVLHLTDSQYVAEKFRDFRPDSVSTSTSFLSQPVILTKESFETTHLSIVDQDGNAASVTTTLNNNYGCKVWVPGGGYFLNNEMDDFSIKPGVPNLYGLIGGEANAIAPGKRMLSSMTPTIIEKKDSLWMVLGTPGGSTIITSVLQVFLNVAAHQMTVDEAVQAPRFHHQWLPDEIMLEESGFPPTLLSSLQKMGHKIKPVAYIGLVEAIHVDGTGRIHGAADHRGDDHAAAWK